MSAPQPSKRIWQGIEADDPPEMRRDYAELAETARSMLETRLAGFPARIAAGEMTRAQADAELTIFEDIAAVWRWIVEGGDEPAVRTSAFQRREALDRSLATIAGIARRKGGFDRKLSHQAQRVIALRWHLEPGRQTVALAWMSHQLRADAAANRKAAGHVPQTVT